MVDHAVAAYPVAEVHAVHCKDFQRAEKIIRQMEIAASFSPQQVEAAQAQLKHWRAAKPLREA